MAEGLVLQEFKMALGPRASPLSLLGVHSEAGTAYPSAFSEMHSAGFSEASTFVPALSARILPELRAPSERLPQPHRRLDPRRLLRNSRS